MPARRRVGISRECDIRMAPSRHAIWSRRGASRAYLLGDMVKSAVTCSLVPEAAGGPFVFWEDLERAFQEAKDLGFDAIEIFAPSGAALRENNLPALVDRFGIPVAAVGTGAGALLRGLTLSDSDTTVRDQAIDFVREIIDAGAEVDAPAIIGSMQGKSSTKDGRADALDTLGASMKRLADHASQKGQILLIEPLNRYESNLLSSVQESIPWLDALEASNLKFLCDLFHMNIEEVDIAKSLTAAGSRVGHIHFVDSNRRAAGMGHMDYAPIADAVKAIGFAGYLSAEAFALPDGDAAARQTINTFRHWFR